MKPCTCGSGQPRYELRDAAGIFCTFVCIKCEARKRASFNPAIFEDGPYAASGDERDLEVDHDWNSWKFGDRI